MCCHQVSKKEVVMYRGYQQSMAPHKRSRSNTPARQTINGMSCHCDPSGRQRDHAISLQDTVRPYATPAMYRFLAHLSLTWVEGKAEVRRVSWGLVHGPSPGDAQDKCTLVWRGCTGCYPVPCRRFRSSAQAFSDHTWLFIPDDQNSDKP